MTNSLIIQAIRGKKQLQFIYDGRVRYADPHVYGEMKTLKRLRCWQSAGESKTGKLPGWRTFTEHKISDLRVLETSFVPQNITTEQAIKDFQVVVVRVVL